MLEIKNSTEGAELYIYGDIIDDADGSWLSAWGEGDTYEWPSKIKQQLDELDDNAPLTVYINSDGGSISAGVAISSMIARHKGPTKCIVDGWAASIASQIFLSADERIIPENAYMMIHKPAVGIYGNADDLKQAIRTLNTMQGGIEATYNRVAKETTTPEQITKMVNAETWLTGAEVAEYFNVTVIPAVKAVAYAGKKMNIAAPEKLEVVKAPDKLVNEVIEPVMANNNHGKILTRLITR